jgi:hypothetical protein
MIKLTTLLNEYNSQMLNRTGWKKGDRLRLGKRTGTVMEGHYTSSFTAGGWVLEVLFDDKKDTEYVSLNMNKPEKIHESDTPQASKLRSMGQHTAADEENDRHIRQPGESWKMSNGTTWGAKNRAGKIRYFGSKEYGLQTQQFAKKYAMSNESIDDNSNKPNRRYWQTKDGWSGKNHAGEIKHFDGLDGEWQAAKFAAGSNKLPFRRARAYLHKEGAAEHEQFKDHTKNPFHKTLTAHGFQHKSTEHKKNQFAANNPNADYTEHRYEHPNHGKSHVIVTQNHGHTGPYKNKKPYSFTHVHQQPNGIMAPSSGDSKPQLHKSLSREYGEPKNESSQLTTSQQRKRIISQAAQAIADRVKNKNMSFINAIREVEKQFSKAGDIHWSKVIEKARNIISPKTDIK